MKVLIGYDGREAAKNALGIGIAMAKNRKLELHIIHSVSISKGTTETYDFIENIPASQLETLNRAKKVVAEAEDIVEKAGLKIKTHLIKHQASPGEDIVELAKELAVDYIVVGIQSRSRLGKVLFGSTAQFVILKAPCPVVTTK